MIHVLAATSITGGLPERAKSERAASRSNTVHFFKTIHIVGIETPTSLDIVSLELP